MKLLRLLPIGNPDAQWLAMLAREMPRRFGVSMDVAAAPLDPAPAFHGERAQYHSSELLRLMQPLARECWRLLGVTGIDLYIPILTFVFGEAQMDGPCAVVSAHRLRQEFYGLAANPELLLSRLLKEALHELGHTLHLTHCQDYRCAMAPSHAVEYIDIKESALCPACYARAAGSQSLLPPAISLPTEPTW